jgi:hypothetical protein
MATQQMPPVTNALPALVFINASNSLFIPERLASKAVPLVRLKEWRCERCRERPAIAECALGAGKPNPVH